MTASSSQPEEFSEHRTNSSQPNSRGRRREQRRILYFLTVVSTVFLSGTWLSCATWYHFSGVASLPQWAWVPYALTGSFIGSMFLGMRFSNPVIRAVYRIAAVWLGFLNFFLFAAFACWIVDIASMLLGLGISKHGMAIAFYGLGVLAGAVGMANASWLRVTHRTVKLPNLPPAWQRREVLLMSDLHLGNVRGVRFMRRVVRKVLSLKPHAVFISGDLFDGPKADYDQLAAPCRELTAPAGVYFVTGNHEEFSDRARYVAAVERTGVRVLANEKVTVDGLQIIGVFDSEAAEPEVFQRILREASLDRRQPSVLLSHQPGHKSVPEAEGISLQVSGHTHKGQFWPWSWIIFRVHGPFAYGLNRFGKLQMVTSSGAGTWGPPMRLGTRSEIGLIRLEKED